MSGGRGCVCRDHFSPSLLVQGGCNEGSELETGSKSGFRDFAKVSRLVAQPALMGAVCFGVVQSREKMSSLKKIC